MKDKKAKTPSTVGSELIERKIYYLRGKRIMFDRDLAILYGVPTRALNQAVRRNINRFPDDFMFQLSKEEFIKWKSQIGFELINSVDDVCHYRLIPVVSES